jgi:hypothetical protein
MTREQIEAGLADGTLERGVTRRWAKGRGEPPSPGQMLLPEQVDRVHPAVRGRDVVAWIALEGEVTQSIAGEVRWGARVVAVGRRVPR